MTTILDGVLKQKTIELVQVPANIPEGNVQVIVIAKEPIAGEPRFLTFGKYPADKESTLEDFRDAQWHGEEEFDDLYGQ